MSPARPQPEQQAPPVQRLRLRYAKTGRARFTSHRDFSRAFERALRRAGVPMAYSSGFSPHPRISYANASPTGAATDAEYLEIGLSARRDPETVRQALNTALPDGLEVREVVEADGGSLADRLTASVWELDIPGLDAARLHRAVAALLAVQTLPVQRMTKTGLREFDARGAILDLRVLDDRTLRLVSRHEVPLVRPDDVIAALTRVDPEFVPAGAALFHRRAQGLWTDGRLLDAFGGADWVL